MHSSRELPHSSDPDDVDSIDVEPMTYNAPLGHEDLPLGDGVLQSSVVEPDIATEPSVFAPAAPVPDGGSKFNTTTTSSIDSGSTTPVRSSRKGRPTYKTEIMPSGDTVPHKKIAKRLRALANVPLGAGSTQPLPVMKRPRASLYDTTDRPPWWPSQLAIAAEGSGDAGQMRQFTLATAQKNAIPSEMFSEMRRYKLPRLSYFVNTWARNEPRVDFSKNVASAFLTYFQLRPYIFRMLMVKRFSEFAGLTSSMWRAVMKRNAKADVTVALISALELDVALGTIDLANDVHLGQDSSAAEEFSQCPSSWSNPHREPTRLDIGDSGIIDITGTLDQFFIANPSTRTEMERLMHEPSDWLTHPKDVYVLRETSALGIALLTRVRGDNDLGKYREFWDYEGYHIIWLSEDADILVKQGGERFVRSDLFGRQIMQGLQEEQRFIFLLRDLYLKVLVLLPRRRNVFNASRQISRCC
ncbi:hypothetical protein EXIGLDRAFT_706046 [Exidia glandulosa HHB12029]|uniref:Uncharacterized protein n=1 Tax=Exidia glandulosa HHB12029 TaxID=1314781 RepID=A0A165B780_EXIGL|nr:hypothetical protein EXIGLDRAFT_706046 [Exidia glandulosa HHB12029]